LYVYGRPVARGIPLDGVLVFGSGSYFQQGDRFHEFKREMNIMGVEQVTEFDYENSTEWNTGTPEREYFAPDLFRLSDTPGGAKWWSRNHRYIDDILELSTYQRLHKDASTKKWRFVATCGGSHGLSEVAVDESPFVGYYKLGYKFTADQYYRYNFLVLVLGLPLAIMEALPKTLFSSYGDTWYLIFEATTMVLCTT
jgi:hypothetical protein